MSERFIKELYSLDGLSQEPLVNVIDDRNPVNGRDNYPTGTLWVNDLTDNAFVSIGGRWTDLAGGPGNGTYASITAVGSGNAIVALLGAIVANVGNIQGEDIEAPNGTAISPTFNTASLVTDNIIGGVGSTITLSSYPNLILRGDSSGDIISTPMVDGQVLIGAQPPGDTSINVFTSTQGSIGFTFGPGTIDMDIVDNSITTQIDTDSGSATPTGDLIVVDGGTAFTTGAIGRTVTTRLNDTVSLVGFMAANTLACGGALTAGTGLTVTAGNFTISAGRLGITAAATNGINISTDPFVRTSGLGTITLVGRHSALSVTGGNNTILGTEADRNLTTGTQNVLIGSGTTQLASGGTNNAVLFQSGANVSTVGSGSVVIINAPAQDAGTNNSNTVRIGTTSISSGVWASSTVSVRGGVQGTITNCLVLNSITNAQSNRLDIGASTQTAFYIGGGSTVYGASVGATNDPMLIDNANIAGTTVSSRRYKQNIEDMGEESASIMKLRPVTFFYKKDVVKRKQYGLIAEEVDKVFPYLVNYDEEGKPLSVRYHEIPVMLLNELQKAEKRVAAIEQSL